MGFGFLALAQKIGARKWELQHWVHLDWGKELISPPPPHPISTISQSYWVPIIKLVFYKIKTLSSASCNVRYSLQKHVHLNVHLLCNCLCGGFPVGSKFQPWIEKWDLLFLFFDPFECFCYVFGIRFSQTANVYLKQKRQYGLLVTNVNFVSAKKLKYTHHIY